MDFLDPRAREIFFEIHKGLPREGPGNRESTARALELAGPFPEKVTVLDIACGPGQQTMDLAQLLPGAQIVALDNHRPFLEELTRRALAAGAAARVRTVLGDMAELPFEEAQFDLIWCEAAAYIMGVEKALRSWSRLLKPGGRLAVSEAVWLRTDPPDEVRQIWAEGYPDMRDLVGSRALVQDCGYELLGDFVLPGRAWWEYYNPIEERLAEIAPKYAGDPLAEAVLQAEKAEIETYRKYATYYGYAFLVMAWNPDSQQ
jgi:ubiquinone/menaquinone biosynthesis C-methylase UbiE